MELTVSISTVISACLGFLGVYVLMPFALIGRDFLILKFIERYILNDEFWTNLRIVNTDKAIHNYQFAGKKSQVKISNAGQYYTIDGREVTESEYLRFERGLQMHLNRINQLEPKILLRTNFIVWADKYFKLESGLMKQIDRFSKRVYERETRKLKNQDSKAPKK
ncbi:hypothetical protein [Klebsiella aerogenes]|uniref:hypothetical protein n=1 Tax=Klebsiella aerogenes TaxID=548 RepID=UPI001919A52F|nr:hypothetical protein [Klebsiella aerogenes]